MTSIAENKAGKMDMSRDFQGSVQARVLIVDDDEIMRNLLSDFLKDLGYLPDTVQNGNEAIQRFEKAPFDLVLLDLVLPGMSGQDVFEAIQSIDDTIPIIILTGYGTIENAVEFFKNGAADYLTKPIRMEEFRFRINRVLEEKRMKEQLITDLKTQLFNHSYFQRRLEEEYGRGRRYGRDISLMMIDLDDFKLFNDTHGHVAGDAVLREIGAILKELTRDSDVPCRFGGEEFSVILPETDLKGAVNVAERIRNQVESSLFDKDSSNPKRITVSIGVACSRPVEKAGAETGMNSLVESADAALYQAKRNGKNRVSTDGTSL